MGRRNREQEYLALNTKKGVTTLIGAKDSKDKDKPRVAVKNPKRMKSLRDIPELAVGSVNPQRMAEAHDASLNQPDNILESSLNDGVPTQKDILHDPTNLLRIIETLGVVRGIKYHLEATESSFEEVRPYLSHMQAIMNPTHHLRGQVDTILANGLPEGAIDVYDGPGTPENMTVKLEQASTPPAEEVILADDIYVETTVSFELSKQEELMGLDPHHPAFIKRYDLPMGLTLVSADVQGLTLTDDLQTAIQLRLVTKQHCRSRRTQVCLVVSGAKAPLSLCHYPTGFIEEEAQYLPDALGGDRRVFLVILKA